MQARALAYAGVEAYAAADYQTAHEKLEGAFGLLQVPTLGLWSARAFVKLGRLVDAERRYKAVSLLSVSRSDSPVQGSAKVDAARERQELLRRIPALNIRFVGGAPEPIEVAVDGVVLGQVDLGRAHLVDPGRHVVVGRHGAQTAVAILELAEGEHEEAWLRFPGQRAAVPRAPVTEPDRVSLPLGRPSAALQTVGWVTLALGGASAATGVVGYIASRDEHADVERLSSCSSASCAEASPDAYRAYGAWRTVQFAGLLSGGLLSAAAVTLLIASYGPADAAEPTTSARLGLRLGPASAYILGNF